MNKKMTMILGGAAVGAALLLAPIAGAQPTTAPTPPTDPNAWAQNIQICASTSCYPGGTSQRGPYVAGTAQNGTGPGYAGTLMQHAQDPPGGTTSTAGTGPANSSFGQGQQSTSPFGH
jgi:hypothetical protein